MKDSDKYERALQYIVDGQAIFNLLLFGIQRDGPNAERLCAYCGVKYEGWTTVPHFEHKDDCPAELAKRWILDTVDIIPVGFITRNDANPDDPASAEGAGS